MRATLPVFALLLAAVGSAQVAPRTRAEIVEHALTAVGSSYVWGGSNWDPANRSFGGADCSGLVGKAWAVARWVPYRQSYHPYATIHLIKTPGPCWSEVAVQSVVTGDALVYRYKDNSGGHTYIYEGGDGWGSHRSLEAAGRSIGIVHRWRNPPASYSAYKGIRRSNLVENLQVSDLVVESDHGAPSFTHTGSLSSSGYDSYAHFLRDGQCAYAFVTSASAQTATFQPYVNRAGLYKVFVSCNQSSPNVANVEVRLHHAGGTSRFSWDQARDGVNQWHRLGGVYSLRLGRTDKLVLDAKPATPRTGTHVFRADAAMFRLSNEVVVDGKGGAPGRFASLRAALTWLRANPSLDPDRIDITVDHLVEPGPLDIDVLDDLEINGDGDQNAVPCTVVIPPGKSSHWSVPTGIYLDIPIQRKWTLRDLTCIPAYQGKDVATGAVALVVDNQGTASRHNGFALRLTRVTLTASLANNLPASPDRDQRQLATRWGGGSGDESGCLVLRGTTSSGDGNPQSIYAEDLVISHADGTGAAFNAVQTDLQAYGECQITYGSGTGLAFRQGAGSSFSLAGAGKGRRVLVAHNRGTGIRIEAPAAAASRVDIRDCNILFNGSGSNDAGLVSASPLGQMQDCILAFNARYNWYQLAAGTAAAPLQPQASRCTFHDARYPTGDSSPVCVSQLASHNRLTFTDCIFSGPADPGRLEALYLSDNATGTTAALVSSGLVTKGSHALSGSGIRQGATRFTLQSVLADDPRYLSLDPASKDFLVVSAAAYANAGSNGGPLTGGAAFAHPVEMMPYGKGCPGAAQAIPALVTMGGDPTQGNSAFTVWVVRTNIATSGLLLAGPSDKFAPTLNLTLPLNLGFLNAPACNLLTDYFPVVPSFVTTGTTPGSGYAVVPLPVPKTPSLQGQSIYLQACLFDPKAQGGICLSNGLGIRWR